MPAEPTWKRRSAPRTTCDQCGKDYAEHPERCVTATIPDCRFYSETICVECVRKLNVTGIRVLHWNGTARLIPFVLGQHPRPKGCPYAKPTPMEVLRALSSGGYRERARDGSLKAYADESDSDLERLGDEIIEEERRRLSR